jgi:competence protein ComEC
MKRPLVLCFVVYLVGMLLGFNNIHMLSIFLLVLTMSFISFHLYKTYKRKWVIVLPFICFFSYMTTIQVLKPSHPNLDTRFDEKIKVDFTGIVEDYDYVEDKIYATVRVDELTIKDFVYASPLRIILTIQDPLEIQIRDTIKGTGTLYKFQEPRNDGAWNESLYYKIRRYDYKVYAQEAMITNRQRTIIRQPIKDFSERMKNNFYYILPDQEAGIVIAMVLGDRNGLNERIKDLFQKSGMIHILAISGLHISLLGISLFFLLKRCHMPIKWSAVLSVLFLIIYAYMTGSSISTVRAVMMVSIVLGGYIVGRSYDIFSALVCAALSLLSINPLYLLDTGFQLSFSAVLGITLLTPCLENIMNKKKEEKTKGIIMLRKIRTPLCVSIAAYISTAPIIAFYYYELPMFSVFVNLLVVPLLSILVPLAVASGLLGFINIFLSKMVVGLVFFILKIYEKIGELVELLPYHSILIGRPSWFAMGMFCSILLYFITFSKIKDWIKILNKQLRGKWTINYKWVHYTVVGFLSFLIFVNVLKVDRNLVLTFLDVGQGDAIYMKAPNGVSFLIDGGGSRYENIGTRRLLPFLKYHGVKKVDYMFFTHGDADHVLGLLELFDYIEVGHLFLPYVEEEDELYSQMVQAAIENNVPMTILSKGSNLQLGALNLECLHPQKNMLVKNKNDYSLVLSLTYGHFSALLTGDIEKEQEFLISEEVEAYQMIKVPHHGSKTSSTDILLKKVQPKIAIISSGKNNSYGHPHEEVIDRYKSYDTIIYNTANDGAIRITTDGQVFQISTKLSRKE